MERLKYNRAYNHSRSYYTKMLNFLFWTAKYCRLTMSTHGIALAKVPSQITASLFIKSADHATADDGIVTEGSSNQWL